MASQMIGYRQTAQHYYPHVVKGKQFLSVLRGRTLDNNILKKSFSQQWRESSEASNTSSLYHSKPVCGIVLCG